MCLIGATTEERPSPNGTELLKNYNNCARPNCPGTVHVSERITQPMVFFVAVGPRGTERVVRCDKCSYYCKLSVHVTTLECSGRGVVAGVGGGAAAPVVVEGTIVPVTMDSRGEK
mmetsp:Transcript_53401/g.64369  ORF Transcript_53401/g.64369 Transcript_53401/m.64369 type:complete len:115 (+) Transcript_53401:171-515(+)